MPAYRWTPIHARQQGTEALGNKEERLTHLGISVSLGAVWLGPGLDKLEKLCPHRSVSGVAT